MNELSPSNGSKLPFMAKWKEGKKQIIINENVNEVPNKDTNLLQKHVSAKRLLQWQLAKRVE